MKHKMNEVTPKAGTLKRKNEIQNALRKLIASVLMLAVLAMTPGSIMAGVKSGDSCCDVTSVKMNVGKMLWVNLPSREMLKKADREMTINMYRSLWESKVSKFASQFAVSDQTINGQFKSETSITLPEAEQADENANTVFAAENIRQIETEHADYDMNDLFTAEVAGIRQSLPYANADDQADVMFKAENISSPNAEDFGVADVEINRNMTAERHHEFANNSTK